MKKLISILSVVFIAVLTACAQPPTATVPKSPVQQIVGVTASVTPSPTVTKHRTRTFTPSPTVTATFTPLPTSTPNLSPTAPPALEGTAFTLPNQPITLNNVSEVVELARWGNGHIRDVRYSPDGKILGVFTTASQRIFDGATLNELPFSAELWQTAFTINESIAEVKATDTGYELWRDDTFVVNIEQSADVGFLIEPFKFSADRTLLAATLEFRKIGLWDGITGKLLHIFAPEYDSSSNEFLCGDIYSTTFSANNRFLAASCYEGGGVFIWDIVTQKQLLAFSSDSYFVKGLAFSPDNSLLAGVILGGDACLWKTSNGELYACFPDSHISFYAEDARLLFSPNGKHLVGTFRNGEVLVWHVRNQNLLKRLYSPSPSGLSISFSPDTRYLASAAFRDVLVWDIATGQPLESARYRTAKRAATMQSFSWLSGPPGYIEFVAFSPDGNTIVYADDGGEMFTRALRSNAQPERVIPENHLIAYAITFNADGEIVFPDELSDYQNPSFEVIPTYDAVSPNRDFITDVFAQSANGPKLFVRRLSDGKIVFGEEGSAYDVAFSPDGTQLTASIDNTVKVWQVADWTLTFKLFLGLEIRLLAITYSPNGEILATGGNDGKIYLWDARSGRFLRTLESHTEAIGDLAFSPNGKLLASTSSDGTVRLWGIP